ncbi:MADS-box transcription factor 56-like [Triticum dicoccoides]|uniref:MADS-box transcription factor 56-like n=1 Tax=Triticum dicoccoides TaxID=85692 RepID=UPI00188F4614|nr:MADS-box transcription factor 56-like [Triticum dicoccoides]
MAATTTQPQPPPVFRHHFLQLRVPGHPSLRENHRTYLPICAQVSSTDASAAASRRPTSIPRPIACSSLQKSIDCYKAYTKDNNVNNKTVQPDIQQVKADTVSLAKKLEALEVSKLKILGENLGGCSAEELNCLEVNIEKSLHIIRGKKTQVLEQQIANLKEKERTLLKDNEDLRGKQRDIEASLVVPALNCVTPLQIRGQLAPEQEPVRSDEDVETELYIGLPGVRCSNWRSGQAK